MPKRNKIQMVLNYSYAAKRLELIIFGSIILVVLLIILYLKLYNSSFPASNFYGSILDPFLSIATVFIAISIYYKQMFDDWEKSLPLKLTAHFVKGEKYIMTCYEAVLISEADIRNWTQQIGSQMNNGEYLQFKPFFKFDKRGEIITESDIAYKHYAVTYFLSYLPGEETDKKDKEGKTVIAKGDIELKTKYLVWWDNDPNASTNEAIFFDTHENAPRTVIEAIAEKNRQHT